MEGGQSFLKPNSKHEQSLTLSYSKPRFDNEVIVDYRINRNCNLAKYTRTADDYNHSYTGYCYGGGLRGYWGKWSVALYADNGWHFMEGENIGHQAANVQGSVGCRLGNFDLNLYVQNPFMDYSMP